MSSITFWTRLEPFTRLDDIEDGLQATLHDPLWLLARQWQTGEFGAEDARHAGVGARAAGALDALALRAARAARPARTAPSSRSRRWSSASPCSSPPTRAATAGWRPRPA